MSEPAFVYPDDFSNHRRYINAILSRWLPLVAPEDFVPSLRRCLLPGRKIRSGLFLAAADGADAPETLERIVVAIEFLHASSVLVDDVIDRDCFRHGEIASHSLWGTNRAILVAHLLTGAAFQLLTPLPHILSRFLSTHYCMCVGEFHDALLLPSDSDAAWISHGYSDFVAQKTSRLFGFSIWAGAVVANSPALEELDELGSLMGTLYQLANDFHDWQPDNQGRRHRPEDAWPITFGFPLATYIKSEGLSSIKAWLDQRTLTYQDWQLFLRTIWTGDCHNECYARIHALRDMICERAMAHHVPVRLQRLVIVFANTVTTEAFWYHDYNDAD